ncbi:MAG: L-ribulose-5-phosphate 4-epimerase [Cyclobacteriaceae bacterium]
MKKYQTIKEEAYHANMQLPQLGLVLFTFGNASAVDRKSGVFAIKPSGVPYEALKIGDMVVVDFENNILEGDMRPSSDTKTHAVLYKHWKSVGGIVHTHSTYATAWAQSQLDIPIFGTTHADHLAFDVPCAPVMSDEMILGDYEHETGFQILNCFKEKKITPDEVPMVVVANHAPFTWGANAAQAVYHSAVLEEVAKMAWITKTINPQAPRLKASLKQKHYERKHGKDAYYGQS